jgi:flavin reductase (DIM6/NTAB) family NADH-FMN oxidoreductase RutF
MRKVPSSVAVLTVASYDTELNSYVPMGVAVSSLSTVTLDPPTLSFNLKQPSKTLDAIRAAGGLFRVHFPAANRGGAKMVELFSRGNHAAAYKLRIKDEKIYIPVPHAKWDNRATASRAPQIWNDSTRAAIECTLTHELLVADHVIVVARIDSIKSKMQHESAILYHDGTYMRPDGTHVSTRGSPTIAGAGEGAWSVWDYPVFFGEQERHDYVARVKTMIMDNPASLTRPGKEALRELEVNLPYSPSAFGINLEQLLDECRRDSGARSLLPAQLQATPTLCDFYGRITPSDKAKIIDRARNLVRADPRFLYQNYRIFLQHLGVSPHSKNLLPSDFMEPLRADGLVGPFQPRMTTSAYDQKQYDLQYLEQVERRLISHFADLSNQALLSSPLGSVMETLGEPSAMSTYFKRSRARLFSEAAPQRYSFPNVDIAGAVTHEEALVVIQRVISFMQVDNQLVYRQNANLDPIEVLRQVGVHPTISGLDVDFFFGKLKHVFYSTRRFRDFAEQVDKMMEPHFASTVSWEDFMKRAKSFVQKLPLRAIAWSTRDRLAAMGLHQEAAVTVPISTEKQPLNKGHILDTVVAKELKNLYGQASDEVNRAIARYLKQQYNFEVRSKPAVDAPRPRSSGDELEEAMMANRNVDVMRAPERVECEGTRIRYFDREGSSRKPKR